VTPTDHMTSPHINPKTFKIIWFSNFLTLSVPD